MTCSYGSVQDVLGFGVNPDTMEDKSSCVKNADNNICSKYIDDSGFRSYIMKGVGKNHFNVTINARSIYGSANIRTRSVPKQCMSDNSSLYIQYKCGESPEETNHKRKDALAIGCLAIFITCVYLRFLHYRKMFSKIVLIEWDISTITANDYSIEIRISEEDYNWFLEN